MLIWLIVLISMAQSIMGIMVPTGLALRHDKRDTFTVSLRKENINQAVSYVAEIKVTEIGTSKTDTYPSNQTLIKINNICVSYNVCLITTWMSAENNTKILSKCEPIDMRIMYKLIPMTVKCSYHKNKGSIVIKFSSTYVKVIFDVIVGNHRDRYTTNVRYHMIKVNNTDQEIKVNHVSCMECQCYNNDTTICYGDDTTIFYGDESARNNLIIACVVLLIVLIIAVVIGVLIYKHKRTGGKRELLEQKHPLSEKKDTHG